jgi:hypothetical protein
MNNLRTILAMLIVLALIVGTAHARLVTDQSQPEFVLDPGPLAIDNDPGSEQKLAQTFIAGLDGPLTHLKLPVGCSSGALIIEIRRQNEGMPTGEILGGVTVPATDLSGTPTGFRTIELDAPVVMSPGDKLAFTLRNETGSCGLLRSASGDLYTNGRAFFDARPNPPGWEPFIKVDSRPDEALDLAFATLVRRPDIGSAEKCIIPGRIDPATGRPLELPISAYVPACRCFQDAGARELRCGVLHPDFFVIRRIPFPLMPGEPYEEVWQFAPLTKLDGPVRIRLEGGGFEKPVQMSFPSKAQLSARDLMSTKKWNAPRSAGETITLKARAPTAPMSVPGVATFEYDMKDADSEFQKRFGLDITIEKDQFGQ